MGASLSLDISKSYSNTACKVTVKLYVKSTSGSYNNNAQSGYITIDGTKYSFTHTFSSNTTTLLATKSHSVKRTTADKTVSIKAAYATGVSAGTISKNDSTTVANLVKYTITFNANGGSGGSSVSQYYGYSVRFPSSGPTKNGYSLSKWNAKADGSGTNYSTGSSITVTASKTYYAIYSANTYHVAYNANGGTGTQMQNSSHTYGVQKQLTANTYTKTGYSFTGWNTKADGTGITYADQASVLNLTSGTGTVTLYAQWTLAFINPGITIKKSERNTYDADIQGDDKYKYDQDGIACRYTVAWIAGKNADGSAAPVTGIDILRKEADDENAEYVSIFSNPPILIDDPEKTGFIHVDARNEYKTNKSYNIRIDLFDSNHQYPNGYSVEDFVTKSSFIWKVPQDAAKFLFGLDIAGPNVTGVQTDNSSFEFLVGEMLVLGGYVNVDYDGSTAAKTLSTTSANIIKTVDFDTDFDKHFASVPYINYMDRYSPGSAVLLTYIGGPTAYGFNLACRSSVKTHHFAGGWIAIGQRADGIGGEVPTYDPQGRTGGTTNYNELTNKPQIEGVTLSGDKTYEDLNLESLSNTDIEELLSNADGEQTSGE